MAKVICDLAFLNACRSKSLKQKISEKICIPGEVFSLFLLQDFPPTMMLFDLFCKKYQKSENAGHVRLGPWKSCYPREEK
jgi:hypothetical protein